MPSPHRRCRSPRGPVLGAADEPVWHGGQAAMALMKASRLAGVDPAAATTMNASAGMWVGWLKANLVPPADSKAYGRVRTTAGTSTHLEGLAALYAWAEQTGGADADAADVATRAARWFREHAWLKGHGTLLHEWDEATEEWSPTQMNNALDGTPGRPLADDSIFLAAFEHSGEAEFATLYDYMY